MFLILRKAFWLFGLAVFLLVLFLPGYTKLQELRDKNRDLETKIKRISIEKALLQEELKKMETSLVYQEEMARQKLGVVRKGEVPVKIISPEKQR